MVFTWSLPAARMFLNLRWNHEAFHPVKWLEEGVGVLNPLPREELVGGDDQLCRRLLEAVHHRLLPQVGVQGHHRETTSETRLYQEITFNLFAY